MKFLEPLSGWQWVLLAISIIVFGLAVWINEIGRMAIGGEGLFKMIGGML